MSAYRDRYAEVEKAKGQVVAISMDDAATLKRFKEELKAPYVFVADPDAKIVGLYDVKSAAPVAKRTTFVIGQDRKVIDVQSGSDALDPSKSIASCPLHRTGPKKGS